METPGGCFQRARGDVYRGAGPPDMTVMASRKWEGLAMAQIRAMHESNAHG